jgi:heme A synthase
MLAALVSVALVVIALVIVMAGGLGEGLAIYTLYRGSELADARRWVFLATLFLLAAVVAGPLLAGARGLWSFATSPWPLFVQLRRVPSDQAKAAEAQGTDPPKTAGGPAPDRITEDSDP